MTPLPNGPYPLNDEEGMGWIKVYIYSPDYQACYVKRNDFNMDIKIFKVTRDEENTVTARHLAADTDYVCCRVFKERYNARTKQIEMMSGFKHHYAFHSPSVKELRTAIQQEVNLWPKYDAAIFHSKELVGPEGPDGSLNNPFDLSHLTAPGAASSEAQNDKKKKKKKQKKKQKKKDDSGPEKEKRVTKRRLAFNKPKEQPEEKRPRVRIVTNLDKVVEAHAKINKEIQMLTWAQEKLMYLGKFATTLKRKPQKITEMMFGVMQREDVVNAALQLAKHCPPQVLEDVLEQYRFKVLDDVQDKYGQKCQEAIELNKKLRSQRKDYEAEDPNVADEWPMDEVAVLFGEDDSDEAQEEPTKAVADTEKEEAQDENAEAQDENAADAEAQPVATPEAQPVATPVRVFKHQPHWIRNPRSATGYKGINYDESRGVYRVKFEGVTIGRYASLDKACQRYYERYSRNTE